MAALPVCAHARHRPTNWQSSVQRGTPNAPSSPCNACDAIRNQRRMDHTNQSEKTAEILIRRTISAQIRRPSPSGACPQDDPPHCPQETSHNHSTPSRPHQINWGTGLFREEAATRRPPANAGEAPGMEARRAETAQRVRFTTARRAGHLPARVPDSKSPVRRLWLA